MRRLVLEPSKEWEARGTFNPAAVKADSIHLFYRAEDGEGTSRIGHALLNGEATKDDAPVLEPTEEWERKGLEDPRITLLEGTYYMLYTAFDGKNARIAYATSTDLRTWKKHGMISPNTQMRDAIRLAPEKYKTIWSQRSATDPIIRDKNAVLFPEKVNGKFAMLHRLEPDVQLVTFNSFEELTDEFWEKYLKELDKHIVMAPKQEWEVLKIGAGAPPIKVEGGWLLIYHGVNKDHVYSAGAALLDANLKEISRMRLFSPEKEWEVRGTTSTVVFPQGAIKEGDKLRIFYGAADKTIGEAVLDFNEILASLKSRKK